MAIKNTTVLPIVLPHLLNYFSSFLNASKLRDLAKSKAMLVPQAIAPLQELPTVALNYTTNLMYNLQAAEVRSNARQLFGSDLTVNNAYQLQTEESIALNITNPLAKLNQDLYNLQLQDRNKVQSWNLVLQAQYANENLKNYLAGLRENIAADQGFSASLDQSSLQLINNLAGEIGETRKANRSNELIKEYAKTTADANNQIQTLLTDLLNYDLFKWTGNNSLSLNLVDLYYKANNETYKAGKVTFNSITDEAEKAKIRKWIANDPGASAIWAAEYKRKLDEIMAKIRMLQNLLDQAKYAQGQYLTGNPYSWFGNRAPIGLNLKSGGKVDRLTQFAKIAATETLKNKDRIARTNQSKLQALDKQLDRLNKELILLLRQIFK